MNDPLLVRGVETIGDLNRQVENFLRLQRLARDALLQRLAFQELHHDEVLAFMRVDFVDGADVGMIQGGSSLGFPLKPLQLVSVLGHSFAEELQGDEPAQRGILRLVDHTHAAATELFQDLEMRNSLADFGHRSLRRGNSSTAVTAT